jgi:hypothetical protein
MLENTSAPAIENMSDELALLDDAAVMGDEAALYEYLPELGLDFEGLGALGAARKRRKGRKGRRVSKATRRKLRRAAKARRRRKSGRFAGLEAKKASKKVAEVSKEKGLGAAGRKRRKARRLTKASLKRRGKRIAKKMKRSKRTGRFVGLNGLGLDGLGADFSMGLPDYGSDGLGAAGKKRRRKGGKRKGSRKGRKAHRRGRRSRMSGLNQLANIADGLADAEVQASMPVLGAFEWLATGPGLQALGGVALAPIMTSLAGLLVSYIPKMKQTDVTQPGSHLTPFGKVAAGALGAIGMWELGRAVGSSGLAKFGAFYALGRLVEEMVTKPFVIGKVPNLKHFGLGTYRESDLAPIGDTVRIPDTQELLGVGDTVRVPDTATIGYVNDTVRVPDTSTIGEDDDVDGMGQELIPDTSMEGMGEDEEASVGAEDSDLF